MIKFRDLTANEIECRVQSVYDNGLILLLYKDARVDMNILDETLGVENWQRRHTRDNANCIVSIWDENKCQWIEKEDTGTESKTEAEKGLASDSFKRACTCLGIGRELYTSPFIWINDEKCNIKTKKDARGNAIFTCKDKFHVEKIKIEDKRITALAIWNDTTNKRAYVWTEQSENKESKGA